jgi:hypothetical protein
MQVFLLSLVLLAFASVVVGSPVPATVTVTGNCTVYGYSINAPRPGNLWVVWPTFSPVMD